MKKALLLIFIVILGYFLLWPVAVSPKSWSAPERPLLEGVLAPNHAFQQASFIDLGGAVGPEDIAFGPDHMLYTGVADGRILRINPEDGEIETIAQLEGRPLGLTFIRGGRQLLIADAMQGLLVLDIASGDVSVVATETLNGTPILYADDVAAKRGAYYFSDASTKFSAKKIGDPMRASLLEIWEQGQTGRLLRYKKGDGVLIVQEGLSFANGVAMAGDAVLVNETGRYRIWKIYVEGPKRGQAEIFAENLPGFPDNINPDYLGGYFVGLTAQRAEDVDALAGRPFLRRILFRIPGFFSMVQPTPYGFLLRLDEEGKVVESWQDPEGRFADVTGAERGPDGRVYVSSLSADRIAVLPAPPAPPEGGVPTGSGEKPARGQE